MQHGGSAVTLDMPDLKLIPASQNRSSGEWSDDDYDVVLVDTGQTIGRIFLNTVSNLNPTPWFASTSARANPQRLASYFTRAAIWTRNAATHWFF